MSANSRPTSVWNFIEKYRISIILALIGLFLLGLGILIPRASLLKSEPQFIPAEEEQSQNLSLIKIDVSGAVKNPDVYDLDDGSRVADAIDAAGGLTKSADKDWVAQNLNLAQVLGDGSKLYIPKTGEFAESSSEGNTSLGLGTKKVSSIVNINTATTSELDTLPRIGPVTAQKIIDGRPYSAVDDLINNKILGPKTYEGLKDLVSAQ